MHWSRKPFSNFKHPKQFKQRHKKAREQRFRF
nr:MAG TPA: hypothetical protein [Inoviridae sp.]